MGGGIRVCTVCGGALGTFYLCYHCGGTRPSDPDTVGPEWTCSSCSEPSPTQFACRNCGTRFLYDEVVQYQREESGSCPECKTPIPRGKYICLECGADLRRTHEIPVEPQVPRAPRRMRGEYDEGDVRDIARIPGVGEKKAEDLCRAGYGSLWKVKNANEEMLAAVPAIGPEAAKRIKAAMNLIIVLPRIRSKDDVLDEERECKKCGLPTPLFSDKCIDCGALFDSEDLGESLTEELAREGPNALIEFYGRVLTRRPNDPQLWYALGLSLRQAGRAYAAKKAIERAKKLDPTNPKYIRLEQKLQQSAGEPSRAIAEMLLDEPRPIKATTREPIPEKPVPLPSLTPPPEETPKPQVPPTKEEKACPICGKTIPEGFSSCPSCPLPEEKAGHPKAAVSTSFEELERLFENSTDMKGPEEVPAQKEDTSLTSEPYRIEVVDVSKEEEAKPSVMVGRRPMLSGYGLVNGRGRVNGLINGNGFINGGTISELPLPRGNAIGRYAAIATVLVTLFLIINTVFFIPVEPTKSIRIDGNMGDWQGIGQYDEASITNNPDTSLIAYSLFLEGDTLFFMARVEGTLFGTTTGVNSFYLFIDIDSDNSTGYRCGALGADYMVFADGYDGSVADYGLEFFAGRDRLNWNNWVSGGPVSVAVFGAFIEGAINIAQLSAPSMDSLLAKFVVDDQEGNVGEGLLAVGVTYGALQVTQTRVTGILPAGMTEFLELTFSVTGPPVSLDYDSVVIAHSPGTLIDLSPPMFTVTEGSPVIAYVLMDASILPTGDVVEAGISFVKSNLPVTVRGGPARAYVISPPNGKRIDGLFGDWPSPYVDAPASLEDPSLDIEAYDASTNGETAFFYMRTQAAALRGTFSPVSKSRALSPPSPGGGGAPSPLHRVTGESIARAYIDTDPTNSSGLYVGSLRAKYMLEAKGQFGTLLSIHAYRWEGRWVLFQGSPKFAKGEVELEMSLLIPSVSLSNCSYVLETSDWHGAGDVTVMAGTRSGLGTRTRGGSIIVTGSSTLMYAYPTENDPMIDGDWSATEWQDADSYSTGSLTIYTMQNGTHLFLAIRAVADTVYNSGDYAEVAFDTDNGDESGPDEWDKMFNATDPDGSTVNEDYKGDGTWWDSSYESPYQWSANGELDTDSGNYVTYEFAIPFQEVWNTSSPSAGQLAGMAIHVHDSNDTGFDYYWGCEDLGDPSSFGHVQIPEFGQFVAVFLAVPAIAIMIRRRGKNNKPRGH